MRLYAFHAGGEIVDWAVIDPFHPEVGTKVMGPYFFYLIEHPDGNVLFDTGAHRLLSAGAPDRYGDAGNGLKVVMGPRDDAVSQLAAVGLQSSDVRHVVLSHLHYDHAGALECFSGADAYVQRRELDFARNPPVYQRGMYLSADFDCRGDWVELDGELDLFGDNSIVAFPTPGHTAGHQSLLVRLSGRAVILAGDAAYSPRNIERNALPAVAWSPDAMVASWQRLRDLRQECDAELLITHDLAWETSTRVAPGEWYE